MYAHVEPIRDKYAMSDNIIKNFDKRKVQSARRSIKSPTPKKIGFEFELFRFSLIIFFHLGEGQFET